MDCHVGHAPHSPRSSSHSMQWNGMGPAPIPSCPHSPPAPLLTVPPLLGLSDQNLSRLLHLHCHF